MNSSTPKAETVSVRMSPATIGCLVLLGSFFLPWINFIGISVAGYKIPELSAKWQWLWLIPTLSGIAALLGFAGKRHIEVAQLAGGVPLVALVVVVYQNGADIFQLFLVGAYTTLATGLFLLCIAPRLRKTDKSESPVVTNTDNT